MAVTRIRNPLAFGVSLVLLVSATALGLVLHHDAELGAPGLEAVASDGGSVRLKGDLSPFQPPGTADWQPVREVLSNSTLWLRDAAVDDVLVTGVGGHAAGEDRIVHGAVVYAGAHPDHPGRTLLVVQAESVYEPFFAW